MSDQETVKVLNKLLEMLYDSRNGYKECAEEVSSSQLKNMFTSLVHLRETMIKNLEDEVQNYHGNPVKSDSMLAAAHRIFVDIKSFFTGGDVGAIVKEIQRGENLVIDRYKDALDNKNLPQSLHQLLDNHLREIQNNLKTIESVAANNSKS